MKKLFAILLTISLTFSLVACKKDIDLPSVPETPDIPLVPLEPSTPGVDPELSVEEQVLKILTNLNFEDLLNTNTNIDASVNIKEFATPVDQETSPTGIKLKNINLAVKFESNFKELETSKFNFSLIFTIEEIILIGYEEGVYAETPLFGTLSIHQQFKLLNNNVYSSMEAFIHDNDSNEDSIPNELKDLLDFYLTYMGFLLPEQIQPYLDSLRAITPILENKKEVIKDVFTNEIHTSMHETLEGLQFLIKMLLTIEILEDSILDMSIVDNGVEFNNKVENDIPGLNTVEILLEVKDNKFSSLKGKVEFSLDEVNNSVFELLISTNNETIFDTIEDIDDYIEVEEFTFITVILDAFNKLPVENPL